MLTLIEELETTWQDLRYALRMLGRNPGFATVVVLTLALGIGANTAIFNLIDAVLLKMLPVKHPEQLVFLEKADLPQGSKRLSYLPYSFFDRLHGGHEMLAGVCTFGGSPRVNVVVDGQAEVAQGQQVSGGFFSVLGVNALLGRTISEKDDQVPGGHPVTVISYRYWQRRFAGDPAVVGKSIAINGNTFTIIGVTPPEFFGVTIGEAPDLWAPAMMYAQIYPGQSIDQYFNRPLAFVLSRLKPGVTEQQARSALTGLWQQSLLAENGAGLSPEKEQSIRQQRVALKPASQGLSDLREQFSEPLRVLMVVVGLILLIACANVANLWLARAAARQKEIAVRLALGASRLRLIRQLLTESLLLAVMGGALGLLLASWASGLLLALVGSGHNPVVIKVTLDARMLAFTAAASMLAGIVFGLAPAWPVSNATRVDLTPALKDSTRGAGARLGLGKTLVIVQVALSLLLLIGAGLFIRSLEKLKGVDAGLNQENVLLASTDPRLIGYQGRQIAELYQRLLGRISAIPGVRSASLSRQGLLGASGTSGSVYVQGPAERPNDKDTALGRNDYLDLPALCQVGPDYFETVGMTIVRGRGFTAQDDENAPKVAVINESFASYYFGNDDPLGTHFGSAPESRSELQIVGIVKDAKYNSLREPSLRTYYVPYLQSPASWRETTLQIRTADDPMRMMISLHKAVREVDANLPLFNVKTLARQVDESLVQERLIGTLSSFFGLLSLLLASIGLYGIMTYAVSQRTREIGIRMALGAQRTTVLRMVLKEGLLLVLIGVFVGISISFAATRVLASQLFGVTPTDSMTFVGVSALLLTVALLACFVPASRASRVDPLEALRVE